MLALALTLVSGVALSPTVEIAPGVAMPRLNLGTCCGSDPSVGLAPWIAAGGSGIDTAFDYGDQQKIGKLITTLGLKRSDFFITTKVPAGVGALLSANSTDCSVDPSVALNYVKTDLAQLGLDFVDLVILHGPCRFGNTNRTAGEPGTVADPTAADNALWAGLQTAQQQGLARAIGVSNFNVSELRALRGAVPALNQCQMGVQTDFNYVLPIPDVAHDDETIAYCAAHNITYEAWRVLGGCPMSDARVLTIAAAHGASAAQVCLRWTLQRGAVIAAGTGGNIATVAQYAKENLAVLDASFELSDAEMDTLNKISPQ